MLNLRDKCKKMKVAIYYRELSPANRPSVELLESRLMEGGAELYVFGRDFDSHDNLPADAEMLLSLGGDGTFLQSLTFLRGRRIPLAGINFGRLGFLTTAKVSDSALDWVDDLLAGRYNVEHRHLLKVQGDCIPDNIYSYACNEVSLQRLGGGMLTIDLLIDGTPIPSYWADGIIIATPTGSTAYSMSVGGPIVMPSSKVAIVTPIAPHNLNVRPLVVPLESSFEIRFRSREGRAVLNIDNRSVEMTQDNTIRITCAEYGFDYVALSHNSFINALRTKLLWGEDKRNTL